MGYDATHTFDLIQGSQTNHILYLGSRLDGKEEGLEFGRGGAVMYSACLPHWAPAKRIAPTHAS